MARPNDRIDLEDGAERYRARWPPESGFYDWRTRAPSGRSIRHALLIDAIREIHAASWGTCGFAGCTRS